MAEVQLLETKKEVEKWKDLVLYLFLNKFNIFECVIVKYLENVEIYQKKGQNENHLIFYNTDTTMVNVAIDLFQ